MDYGQSADINWKESQKYTRGIYCIRSNLMSKQSAFHPNNTYFALKKYSLVQAFLANALPSGLTLFPPAMGGISLNMSVTWQQPVGIGLSMALGSEVIECLLFIDLQRAYLRYFFFSCIQANSAFKRMKFPTELVPFWLSTTLKSTPKINSF